MAMAGVHNITLTSLIININVEETFQFQHTVEDYQILRNKLLISNLLVFEPILRGAHDDTALPLVLRS